MLHIIYSILFINFVPVDSKQQEIHYFKNLIHIENKLQSSRFEESALYQKTPHLITKNHKISN